MNYRPIIRSAPIWFIAGFYRGAADVFTGTFGLACMLTAMAATTMAILIAWEAFE